MRWAQRCRAEVENRGLTLKKIMLFVALISLTSLGWAQSREKSADRMNNAANVLHEIMAAPDKGIPEEVLEHAKCVAVVPHLFKGGFVFGAENGRGVATCRTANGWSAPAFFAITGGSWGLQIGVEGIDLVMIIQNDRGMQQLIGKQVRTWRRCFCGSGAGWTARFGGYGLEAECRDSDLLSSQGRFCRAHIERRVDSPRRRFHGSRLRSSCFNPRCTDGKSCGDRIVRAFPERSERRESASYCF